MQPTIKILITESQLLLAKLLEDNINKDPNFTVIDVLEDINLCKSILEKKDVDVLLLEFSDENALYVLEDIRKNYPELKILILSFITEGNIIKKSIELGANGYVSKSCDSLEIKKAINIIVNGETFFCNLCFHNFIQAISHTDSQASPSELINQSNQKIINSENIYSENMSECFNSITKREKEVLEYLIKERTTKEISELLFISTRTVETHRKHILQKFGVKTTINLIKLLTENTHSAN